MLVVLIQYIVLLPVRVVDMVELLQQLQVDQVVVLVKILEDREVVVQVILQVFHLHKEIMVVVHIGLVQMVQVVVEEEQVPLVETHLMVQLVMVELVLLVQFLVVP